MREFQENEKSKLRVLTGLSINAAYIEPTATGLQKSIMDATGPVRQYLLETKIHDYSQQKQGPDNKVTISAYIVTENSFVETRASLYRPITKQGDPRIWFYRLTQFADPNDILAVIAHNGILFLLNITKLPIVESWHSKQGPIYELLLEINEAVTSNARELLFRLRQLAQAPIRTRVSGDTGVGRTLEHCLGLKMNSLKTPDYNGIELKSFRGNSRRPNRKTLFAQVPNWELSKFKSSAEILSAFGYCDKNGTHKLYCTVSSRRPNSQGLQLRVDADTIYMREYSIASIGDFAIWDIVSLQNRLAEKHRETFWIDAESTYIDGVEHFLYHKVKHTKKPVVSQFAPLVISGDITLDHLIKRVGNSVHEKGPLFKISAQGMPLLFPEETEYSLR